MYRRSLAPRFFSILREKMDRDREEQAEEEARAKESYIRDEKAKMVDNALNNGEADPRLARASRAPRSALFVPCSNVKALKKIPTLKADVFILDLEDSVAIKDKEAARNNLLDFVEAGTEDGSLADKRLIVRINSPTYSKDTMRYGLPDMDAIAVLGDRIEGIGIPKSSARDHVVLQNTIHPEHSVWAFLETPQSIIEVNSILSSGFYKCAAMGLNDLSMELQLPLYYHMSTGAGVSASSTIPVQEKDLYARKEDEAIAAEKEEKRRKFGGGSSNSPLMSRRLPLLFHMMQVINAARAYNVHPLDGVFNDPTDTQGFLNESIEAKRFGFSGKTLIHPNQIDAVHSVFSPTDEEVLWAQRVLDVLMKSEGGVAVLDGKMIEELHGRMARRLLAYAELDGRLSSKSEKPSE